MIRTGGPLSPLPNEPVTHARPWHGSAFTTEEQTLIDQAYDAALDVIDQPAGVYTAIPYDVRHRQAAEAVLIEARQGELEHRRLKGAALSALVPVLEYLRRAERR